MSLFRSSGLKQPGNGFVVVLRMVFVGVLGERPRFGHTADAFPEGGASLTSFLRHCGRSSFRQGRQIQLADGQSWIFPAPPKGPEWTAVPFGTEYKGIIQAILEAEDDSEQRRAELAFAIFLLGHNYRLSPADYERLLGSTPESPDSRDWQLAFHRIAQDHLDAFLDGAGVTSKNGPLSNMEGRVSRRLAWLRKHLPSRWFSFDSRRVASSPWRRAAAFDFLLLLPRFFHRCRRRS